MQKAAAALLAAVWLIVLFIAGRALEDAWPAAQPVHLTAEVTVTEENVNYGSEHLTVDICRPAVSGFSDAQFDKTLNDRIGAQIAAALGDAEDYAVTYGQQIGYPCVFYAAYSAECTERLLSLKVTTFLDNGGTGLPLTVYYNADIEESKYLTLGDLFADGAPFGERIGAVILEEMKEDPERYFFERFAGVDNDTQFFIYEGQLYIAFAKYEIADGMTGEPEFLISAEAIEDMLAPEYAGIFK